MRFLGLAILTGLLLVTGMYNACGRVILSKGPPSYSLSVKGTICAQPPEIHNRYTKILFIVDKSGSNNTTDPGATRRFGAINDFVNSNRDNQNIKWGFIEFNNGQSLAYINDGSEQSPIFSDASAMDAALNRLRSDPDVGSTPYRSALSLAKIAVRNDLNRFPDEDSIYIGIFITDGVPTDYGTPPNDSAIMSDVDDFVSIAPDKTFLSTAYYGPSDPAAISRLQEMAQRGKGKFADVSGGGPLNISELIVGTSGEPWDIKNLIVYNLNISACDDGTMSTDSDGDGLCDKDETKYNQEFPKDPSKAARMGGRTFDPLNRNSFNPAYSDSFYYKYVVFNETLPSCTDQANWADTDHDLVNKCEETFLYNGSPQGPTEAWTQKMLRTANPLNFDSDGDHFLDGLEFLLFRDKAVPLDYTSKERFYSGAKGEDIFIKHLNWRRPSSSPAYDGVPRFSHINSDGQFCYSFEQNVLPTERVPAYGASQPGEFVDLAHNKDENTVMIYYIETPQKEPNGKGVLRYAFQKIRFQDAPGIGGSLRIEDVNFQSYKAP